MRGEYGHKYGKDNLTKMWILAVSWKSRIFPKVRYKQYHGVSHNYSSYHMVPNRGHQTPNIVESQFAVNSFEEQCTLSRSLKQALILHTEVR